MKIQVIVAAHKAYRMPQDPMYLPVQVGKALSDTDLGFQGDDTGDNISAKNPAFCELTGLYWAWKHLDGDFIGLSHYRRYFRGGTGKDPWDCVLTSAQAEALMEKSPVLLPKRRNYFIETVYNQYIHAHPAQGLDLALALAAKSGPAYAKAAEGLKNRTWTHLFNMFIMPRDLFRAYCAWLFDILFQMESQLDTSTWSANDRRVCGFAAERLLDVWLEANGVPYQEVPLVLMEKQNWLKKGGDFLRRKFFPAKERD